MEYVINALVRHVEIYGLHLGVYIVIFFPMKTTPFKSSVTYTGCAIYVHTFAGSNQLWPAPVDHEATCQINVHWLIALGHYSEYVQVDVANTIAYPIANIQIVSLSKRWKYGQVICNGHMPSVKTIHWERRLT